MRCLSMTLAISRISVAFVCLFFFSACTQHSADKALFASLDQTMSQSTSQLQQQLQFKITSLQEELQDPCSRERARQWLSVARRAEQLTLEVVDYFSQAKESAEKGKVDGSDLFDSAYVRLNAYRNDILMLHEKIQAEFTRSFEGLEGKADYQASLSQHLRILQQVDDGQLAVALTQLRYSVMQIGASVVAFCRENVGCFTDRFETYAAIIGQSSTGILPGQNLEIAAGMGAFSKAAQPTITIDGKQCAVEDDGVGRLTIAAGSNPGKYQTTVKIEYMDQDGVKRWINKVVEWEVIGR